MTIKEIVKKLEESSRAYYNTGSSEMSDEEYDSLREELEKFDPENNFLKTVGADPDNSVWPKVQHQRPMGSQLKVTTVEELTAWYEKYCPSGIVCWSEKMDGISISLGYRNGSPNQGVTRGNGTVGDNITPNVLKMKNIPGTIPFNEPIFVRSEAVLLFNDWSINFPEDKNPRNSAAGTSKRLDGSGCEHISLYSYDVDSPDLRFIFESEKFKWLELHGFKTPAWDICRNLEEVIALHKRYEEELRVKLPYEIDGLILRENDIELAYNLGEVDGRPKAQRAYKFKSVEKKSKLLEVIWQTGRTGVITPVAIIDPINIGGVTIQRVSLMNLDEMNRLGVKLGSDIVVKRANDVIPLILSSSGGLNDIAIPPTCPTCDGATTIDGPRLLCTSQSCQAQTQISIVHYLKTIGVKGFGDKIIEKLTDAGKISSPSDLYKMQLSDIADLDGSGEILAAKLLKELQSKSKKIKLPIFIKAIGMKAFGEHGAELMLDNGYLGLEEMRGAKKEDLEKINGIGPALAEAIVNGFQEKAKLIDDLLPFVGLEVEQKVVDGPLSNYSFCFTGFRDKDAVDKIKKLGGKEASGVSKPKYKDGKLISGSTHLVCLDPNAGTEKLKKAAESGVKIISVEELYSMLS